MLGDALGYWLGRKGRTEEQHWLRKRRYQSAFSVAEKRVNQHGVRALFFGRFAWFIHPAIPSAAGLLGIRPRLFLIVDPLLVGLWVGLYMGLGHIVTGAWLSKSTFVIGIISLIIVVMVTVVTVRQVRAYLHRRRS